MRQEEQDYNFFRVFFPDGPRIASIHYQSVKLDRIDFALAPLSKVGQMLAQMLAVP